MKKFVDGRITSGSCMVYIKDINSIISYGESVLVDNDGLIAVYFIS